jgi:hypothetical protein
VTIWDTQPCIKSFFFHSSALLNKVANLLKFSNNQKTGDVATSEYNIETDKDRENEGGSSPLPGATKTQPSITVNS